MSFKYSALQKVCSIYRHLNWKEHVKVLVVEQVPALLYTTHLTDSEL